MRFWVFREMRDFINTSNLARSETKNERQRMPHISRVWGGLPQQAIIRTDRREILIIVQVSIHLPCLPFFAGYLFLQNTPENLLMIYQVLIDKKMYCCYNIYISIRYINKCYGDAYVRIYNFRNAYAKRNERI